MTKQIKENVSKRIKGEARKKLQKVKAVIGKKGEEILDEKPLFAEVGFKAPPSLDERIRQVTAQVQAETVAQLQAQQLTEEQASQLLDEENDFEIEGDVMDMLTQYEATAVITDLTDEVALEATVPPQTEETLPVSPSITPPESNGDVVTE